MKHKLGACALAAITFAALPSRHALAQSPSAPLGGRETAPALSLPANRPARVLIISFDGLHAIDLARFVESHPGSALAELSRRGTTFSNAWQPVGDSSPGLLSFATGGTPNATGIIYSPTWDRSLSPAGSDCQTRGSLVTIDNKLNIDLNAEDAGGGLDEKKLPRDPSRGCAPVYPRHLVRVNTIFEIVRKSGGRTAWTDQHIAYNDLLRGAAGQGLDDSFALNGSVARAKGTLDALVDQDNRRTDAVLNQIRGFDHTGKTRATTPRLFGLTMIAFSGVQKVPGFGYLDADATPTPGLLQSQVAVDANIGRIVAALKAERLFDSTLIVVTAKHGQSPIDPARIRMIDRGVVRGAVEKVEKGLLRHFALDTIGLLWLKDSSKTPAVVAELRQRAQVGGMQKIYAGAELRLKFKDASLDPRGPDIMIETEPGVFYAEPGSTLIAEHGGLLEEDAHVALVLSYPGATGRTVMAQVSITQVAPTVLGALGLRPTALDAVRLEGTPVLPNLPWGSSPGR